MNPAFTTNKISDRQIYDVVYNIYPFVEGLYLANAFVVSKDKEGHLAHIKQKANKSTVDAYQIEATPVRNRLFDLIDRLQPAYLAEKFKPARKKSILLEKLILDDEAKSKIQKFTHGLLDELLATIVKQDFRVSWDVEKRVLVKDFVLRLNPLPLKPHLFFEKTKTSVNYRFWLEDEHGKWEISSKNEVVPITNNPAWLFVDYNLYRIGHVNGNMVKPFRSKDVVVIPTDAIKTYFQTFILKVASKIDIEAIGFDIVEESELNRCVLQPIFDFTHSKWGLTVKMEYETVEFEWNEKRENRITLNFADDENIKIIKVSRDFELERQYLDKIRSHGLVSGYNAIFELEIEHDDAGFQLLEWLIHKKPELENEGITVLNPVYEDAVITLLKPELRVGVEQQNDWFDLLVNVIIGVFEIPFIKFAKNIKEHLRFFKLPDGELFLIPEDWFSRYKPLFQFGKNQDGNLRLARSQYMLLAELDEFNQGVEVSEIIGIDNFQISTQLKATLRPYQLEGVKWLVNLKNNELGACLADDMGLGKTLQTIAVLLYTKEKRAGEAKVEQNEGPNNNGQQLNLFNQSEDFGWLNPLNALVILPASLVFNWEREVSHFAPTLTIYKHTGPKRYNDIKLISRFDVILTTYQTVLRDIDLLGLLEYEYIILDESQQIKNKDSKIFKAINELKARHKLSLSGTPIENSLSDLWAQMHFINPNLLGNFNFFRREFITPIEKKQDEEKKLQLRTLVQPYLLRRTKEEVAKDLPPLSVHIFYSEMGSDQKKVYEKEKSAVRNFLLDNYVENNPKYRMIVLQSLTKLRQLANHPKLVFPGYEKGSSKFSDVFEQWEVVRKGGHKVLMFSSFVKHLELFRDTLESKGESFAWLTGAMDSRSREREIKKFEDHLSVQSFLISIKSGGTGLNLTAADYVFILDPWWNPFTEQQAISRAHRIGQDKNVMAFKFITKDTIEEKILKLQDRKSKLAEDIIEHVQKANFSRGDIEYLLD